MKLEGPMLIYTYNTMTKQQQQTQGKNRRLKEKGAPYLQS